jgi:hypothetical protein
VQRGAHAHHLAVDANTNATPLRVDSQMRSTEYFENIFAQGTAND